VVVAPFLVGLCGDRRGGGSAAGLVLQGGVVAAWRRRGAPCRWPLSLRVAAPLRGTVPVTARPKGSGTSVDFVARPSSPHAGRGRSWRLSQGNLAAVLLLIRGP
jgi:hypothetical protein